MLKVNVRQMWWFLFLAIASYPMAVYASVELKKVILTAPFLSSWFGIWLFSIVGGFIASQIKVDETDNRLKNPIITKIIIGTFFGVAICMFLSDGADPPKLALTAYALVIATCASVVVTGFLVYIADQKRQNKVYKNLQDKYLPSSKDEENQK